MKQKDKCPICGHEIIYEAYSESVGLVESHEECPTCGYYYEFVYGYYLEVIGNKKFAWSWDTPRCNPVFRRIRRAKFMARRNWRKKREHKTKGKNHEKI